MKKLILLIVLSLLTFPAVKASDTLRVGERPWGLRLSQAGMAVGLNAAITEALKNGIKSERPGIDNSTDGFPSRHTSWAFTASTILSNEFYRTAPWVVPASQSLAGLMAGTRVYCGAHSSGQVFAGAAVGIVSTEVAYGLGRVLWGGRFFPGFGQPQYYAEGFGIEAATSLDIESHTYRRSGIGTSIGARFALGSHFGLKPVIYYRAYGWGDDFIGLELSAWYRYRFGASRWAVEPSLGLGYLTDRELFMGLVNLHAEIAAVCYLTERLALKGGLGAYVFGSSDNTLSLSLGSIAYF